MNIYPVVHLYLKYSIVIYDVISTEQVKFYVFFYQILCNPKVKSKEVKSLYDKHLYLKLQFKIQNTLQIKQPMY